MATRTLKLLCAASILLNLFLVGAGVGGAVWWRTRAPMVGAGAMRVAGSELSAEQRRAFREALHEERRALRPTIMAGRQARAQAAALLRAPVLDQAALGAALARARAADIAVRTRLETRAIGVAATLAPEERARLAEGVERRAGPRRVP